MGATDTVEFFEKRKGSLLEASQNLPELQPLAMAINSGDRQETMLQLSILLSSRPGLAPKSKTGIPGEVRMEGRVFLPNPIDRAKRVDRIVSEKDKYSSVDLAKHISQLNKSGEVTTLQKLSEKK